jgi:RNA-directed DNA polymerase
MEGFDSLAAALCREFVPSFSSSVLGIAYDDLKKIVYPKPRYRNFIIAKRNGSPRSIDEPLKSLKKIQRKILAHLESYVGTPRKCVHGFVRDRSIVTNAIEHCSPKIKHILNVDLSDFFPSITFKRVRGALRKAPFGFSHSVASLVAHICTHEGKLPQGAPTSPFLSNLICRSLDRELTELARRCRATYTRYADDLTFSLQHPQKEKLPVPLCSWQHGIVSAGDELRALISKHGFLLNDAKTRLSDRFSRMEVTGLTVNCLPNVRRQFVDKIRGGLHAWETFGYVAAQDDWLKKISSSSTLPPRQRCWSRQTRTNNPPELKNVLWGRLLYLRMVRGKTDLLYTRLAERYNFLLEVERLSAVFGAPMLPIEPMAQDRETAEDAVFMVKWNGIVGNEHAVGGNGTAFAYGSLNLLVTCDHVLVSTYEASAGHSFACDYLADDTASRSLQLVRPRTKEEFEARVLCRSKQLDLALLAFKGVPPSHKYLPRISIPLKVGAPGTLIGFPAYKKWNRADFLPEYVLNHLEPYKSFKVITITGAGSIRPGNSGGPFVDDKFRVAGVAQQGAYNGVGHDTCLAASVVDGWIEEWVQKGSPELEPQISPITQSVAGVDTLDKPENISCVEPDFILTLKRDTPFLLRLFNNITNFFRRIFRLIKNVFCS